MFSAWFADMSALLHHLENHGIVCYLLTLAVLTALLLLIVPKLFFKACLAGYRAAVKR